MCSGAHHPNDPPETWARPGPRELLLLALLVLAGALLRAAYLDALLAWPYVQELLLAGDARAYHRAALAILGGNPWGVPLSFQDPLYPLFLASVIRVTGSDLAGPVIVQSALGVATGVLTWAIARRMAGRVAGLVAAGLVLLSPVVIYYEGLIEKSPLCIFFLAITGWLLASGIGDGRRARVAGAGAALAAAALLRGNILLLLPLTLLAPFIARPARMRPATGVLLLVAGMSLVLGPTMLRNRAAFGSWALTSGQAGPSFYIGNNPENQTGTFMALPWLRDHLSFEERDWTAEAQRRAGRQLTRREMSAFWFGEGLRYWRDQPLSAARNQIRKSLLYLNEFEQPDTRPYPFFRTRFGMLRLPLPGMGPIIALSTLGVVLSLAAWRNRGSELLLFLGYAATVVVFFVLGRYRIVALPFFAVFAGTAVAELVWMVRRRAVVRFLLAAIIFAMAFLVTKRGRYPETWEWPLFNVAVSLVDQGRFEEAGQLVEDGLLAHPGSMLGLELRAGLAMNRGNLAEAEDALQGALAYAPDRISLKLALVRLRHKQGRTAEAEALIEEMLRDDPFDRAVRRERDALRRAP